MRTIGLWTIQRRSRTALERATAIKRGYLEIGEHTYGHPTTHIFKGQNGKATIGRYSSIANGCDLFLGGEHRPDWVTSSPLRIRFGLPGAYEDGQPMTRGDIVVGNDVWIASNATVLSGVTIGHGAIVGAGAVVSRDVRPYSIVVGNPASEVRRRFDDEEIEALLEIAWWDWSNERVKASVGELCQPDISRFLEHNRPDVALPVHDSAR